MHSDAYAEQSQNEKKDILDYVLDLIDDDLGEGHLEYFQQSDLDLDIQYNDLQTPYLYHVVIFDENERDDIHLIFHYAGFSPTDGCSPNIPLRGPPQV